MNQAFTVTPNTASQFEGTSTVGVSNNVVNSNAREFTAEVGSVESVNIRLAQSNKVVVTGGKVTFDRVGAAADFGTPGDAVITRVNGTTTNTNAANNIVPQSGKVTFRVDGPDIGFGDVIPVVFVPGSGGNLIVSQDTVDADGDGQEEGTPTAGFAIGGRTRTLPTESGNIAAPAAPDFQTVLYVDAANQFFVGTGNGGAPNAGTERLFRFGPGDGFQTSGFPNGGAVTTGMTQTQFTDALSADGDLVLTTYSTANADNFNIIKDQTPAPTNVAAATTDTSAPPDGVPDVIRVSFVNPANFELENNYNTTGGYQIQRRVVNNDGTLGTWATLAPGAPVTPVGTLPTGAGTANATVSFNTPVPAAGVYQYRARVEGADRAGAGLMSAWSAATASLTVSADASLAGMDLDAAFVVTEATGASATELDSLDTIALDLNTTGLTIASNASIELVNQDGRRVRITQGVNTAAGGFVQGAAGAVTITLNNAVTDVVGTGAFVVTNKTVQLASMTGFTSVADGTSTPNLVRHNAAGEREDVNGGGTAVPTQITPANVGANASTGLVTVNVGASGATAGQFIRVYDRSGTLLATSPVVPNQPTFSFSVAGLSAGQRLLIVQSTTNTNIGIEGLATNPVPAGTTGGGVVVTA